MREYGFTQAERNTYFDQTRVYSSFGRDTLNDFIVLHVYTPDSVSAENATLLGTKILSLGEVEFKNGGNFIDINVGQHLRDMGLTEGEYKVVYKFLRRLAGRERTILVDGNGQVWTGDYKVKIINNVRRYYTKMSGDKTSGTDKVQEVELFPKDLKYVLTETSPDRTEMKIEVDDKVSNQEYRTDFKEINQLIEYKPLTINGAGAVKFHQRDQYILEFDIDEKDRGFTQNMVGAEIIIPNMYKITGNEDTTNDDIVDTFEEEFGGNLQQQLDAGAATDFLDYTEAELIEILLNDPDPSERALADGALQERANEQY